MQHFNLPQNPFAKLSLPLQQIGELNLKTLQSFSYIQPQELSQLRDPKVLLEKNMQIIIKNSRTSLDYVTQLFSILERSLLNVSQEAKEQSQGFMRETESVSRDIRKAAFRTVSKTNGLKKAAVAKRKPVAAKTSKLASASNISKGNAVKRATTKAGSKSKAKLAASPRKKIEHRA